MRLHAHRLLTVATACALAAGPITAASALDAAVSVTAINGRDASDGIIRQPARGDALIEGTASLPDVVTPPPPPTMLADAGDSAFIERGTTVDLVGIAHNVAEADLGDVTWAWSIQGSAAAFTVANQATATLDPSGLPAGDVVVTLETTLDGVTSSDTVTLHLYDRAVQTLVDTSGTLTPGVPDEIFGFDGADGSIHTEDFALPTGTSDLEVTLTWDEPIPGAYDLDLTVDDPSGAEDGNATGATSANPEIIGIAEPAAGSWSVTATGYANGDVDFDLLATAVVAPANPLPILTTATSYVFELGAIQALTATVAGGQDAELAWDLDGDGVYETEGADAVTSYGLGMHTPAVKATDANGYEVHQLVPVNVVLPGEDTGTPGLVVIAISDTGINLYHNDYRASTYGDDGVLALTDGFTRHPSEYLTGYPADAVALPITLGADYYPVADHALLAGIQPGQLYWVPGTKIVGARDDGGSTGATSAADTVPLLDDDGHGTGSASTAAGNLYGYCPSCLLAIGEGFGNDSYFYTQPWVDIASNSFGAAANVGFAGLLEAAQPKAKAEAGQFALYAAGNGNENAFVTPEQTYTSEDLGADWLIRVGAAVTSSRKPIVGTGKPVDITSWGSGAIPAASRTGVTAVGSHSGTSAATPYTAGVLGDVLRRVRIELRDETNGYAGGIVASGASIATSPYLADGQLSRAELQRALFTTAEHDGGDLTSVYPLTTPNNDYQYLIEGYGLAEPASGQRAFEVLMGSRPLPARPDEDAFYADYDDPIRNFLWGSWNGATSPTDGPLNQPAATTTTGFDGLGLLAALDGGFAATLQWMTNAIGALPGTVTTGQSVADGGVVGEGEQPYAVFTSPAGAVTVNPDATPVMALGGDYGLPDTGPATVTTTRHWLRSDACLDDPDTGVVANNRLTRVDGIDGAGDDCGYNPLAAAIDVILPIQDDYPMVAAELPATLGTGNVSGTVFVNIDTPSPVTTLTMQVSTLGVGGAVEVIASQTVTVTDQIIATNVPFDFDVAVPQEWIGVALDSLTFSIVYDQAQGQITYSLDDEASLVDLPLQGAAPSLGRVELAENGQDFTTIPAVGGTFFHVLDVSGLADGVHTVAVRAVAADGTTSTPDELQITISRDVIVASRPIVQAAVVALGTTPTEADWQPVADTSGLGDFSTWGFVAESLERGDHQVVTRVVVLDTNEVLAAGNIVTFRSIGPKRT